jgi:hypothetical protein
MNEVTRIPDAAAAELLPLVDDELRKPAPLPALVDGTALQYW